MMLKPETVGFVRGGMLFLEPPERWRAWQRNVWSCCSDDHEPQTPYVAPPYQVAIEALNRPLWDTREAS